MSKLKKEDKSIDVSAAFPAFHRFAADFEHRKKVLLELTEFLGKLIGVTNYEYTEVKKVHDEAKLVMGRYQFQKSKEQQTYSHKKEMVYSKKYLKKHFELSKFLELTTMV